MSFAIALWDPRRPVVSALFLPVALLLALAITIVSLVEAMIRGPVPVSAEDMIGYLDIIIDGSDPELGRAMLSDCLVADKRLDPLVKRVSALGKLPFDAAAIDELKAIRDSAQAIASGGAQ